jgi:hypothetical protein
MAAFENGVTFLAVEDDAAELCFERVAREFPACYEAWANLGYARLMRYCGTLSRADLRELGSGTWSGPGRTKPPGRSSGRRAPGCGSRRRRTWSGRSG